MEETKVPRENPQVRLRLKISPYAMIVAVGGTKKSIVDESLSQADSPEIIQECFLVGHPSSHEPHPKGLR